MKTFYSTTITFIAAAIAVSASCQKISENDISSETQTLITRILPVSGELWTPESSKSTFEPGTGLYLTGDEHISVYYSPYVEGYTDLADISDHPVEAVPTGGGLYTFSHEALDAESYNYYFIMPHSEQNRSGNSATRIVRRMSDFPRNSRLLNSNGFLLRSGSMSSIPRAFLEMKSSTLPPCLSGRRQARIRIRCWGMHICL